MEKKTFKEPEVEAVYIGRSVIASSTCGCYDADFCPSDYKNCIGDGAVCECEINHNPALGNCTPCEHYNG